MLTLSVVLGIVQIIAASHAASLQRGYRWSASPRDETMPPLQGVAGRLNRALRNFLETFPLLAAVSAEDVPSLPAGSIARAVTEGGDHARVKSITACIRLARRTKGGGRCSH